MIEKWGEELKKKVLDFCDNNVKNLPEGQQESVLEECLHSFLEKVNIDKIISEFQDYELNKKNIDFACKNVVNELVKDGKIEKLKITNTIKECKNSLSKKFSDPIWREENILKKMSFIAGRFDECIPRVLPTGYISGDGAKELSSCLSDINLQYLKQLWIFEAIDELATNFTDQKLFSDKFFLVGTKQGVYDINKDYIKNNPYLMKKLKLLSAYILTDGSIDLINRNINFGNKSKTLLQKYINLVRELIPDARFTIKESKENPGMYVLSIGSKDLLDLLTDLSPTSRTKAFTKEEISSGYMDKYIAKIREKYPNIEPDIGKLISSRKIDGKSEQIFIEKAKFPPAHFPKEMDEQLKQEVLRVVGDTEGSISGNVTRTNGGQTIEGKINIPQKHPVVREEIKEMLETLNFSPKIRHFKEYPIGVNLPAEDIYKFRQKIGFSMGVPQKKKAILEGIDKDTVLNLSLLIKELIGLNVLKLKYLGIDFDNIRDTYKNAAIIYEKVIHDPRLKLDEWDKKLLALKKTANFLCESQENNINETEKERQIKECIDKITPDLKIFQRPTYHIPQKEQLKNIIEITGKSKELLKNVLTDSVINKALQPKLSESEQKIIEVLKQVKKPLSVKELIAATGLSESTIFESAPILLNSGYIKSFQTFETIKEGRKGMVNKYYYKDLEFETPPLKFLKEILLDYFKQNTGKEYSISDLSNTLGYATDTIRRNIRQLITEGEVIVTRTEYAGSAGGKKYYSLKTV